MSAHNVMLFGRTDMPMMVSLDYLAPMLERPIDYKRAGIFVEQYRLATLEADGGATAVYQGLRRSNELARHFDPARLPPQKLTYNEARVAYPDLQIPEDVGDCTLELLMRIVARIAQDGRR